MTGYDPEPPPLDPETEEEAAFIEKYAWFLMLQGTLTHARFWLLGPPALALLLSLFFDFGSGVGRDFFSATAQVAPVIALAAMLEDSSEVRGIIAVGEAEDTAETHPAATRLTKRTIAAEFVARHLALFAFAEAASLIALAINRSTTFLLVLTISALTLQVVLLGLAHLWHYYD